MKHALLALRAPIETDAIPNVPMANPSPRYQGVNTISEPVSLLVWLCVTGTFALAVASVVVLFWLMKRKLYATAGMSNIAFSLMLLFAINFLEAVFPYRSEYFEIIRLLSDIIQISLLPTLLISGAVLLLFGLYRIERQS